ncbi:MAG: hypothetical protein HKN12_06710 [Gemmatimonadetes bacterium]|nr:hypothetical protein [Gemmatimonadota bacterium]
MNSLLRAGVLGVLVLASGGAAGRAAAQPCPIVDLGSPTDGLTTITLIQPPAPCPVDAVWGPGWMCSVLQSVANDNGLVYRIGLRWNRDGIPSNGTVTWLQGGGKVYHREATTYAAAVQDELDAQDGVRTIEIAILGNGFLEFPRNGFPNLSSIYADLLEFLVGRGLIEGVAVHYGNSSGAMIGANSLAYHGVDQILDGMVLGGGPYWADLDVTCSDPNWADSSIRADVDVWSYTEFNGTTPCSTFSATPNPAYTCRSTLGADAQTVYPGMVVSVIIGTQDPFNPWIDTEATVYFQSISAETKTMDRPTGVGHTVFNFLPGANLAKQRIRDVIAAGPGSTVSAPESSGSRSAASGLLPPLPNPFRASTQIRFRVPRESAVRLTVHDPAGRRVATLIDGRRSAGEHGALWDGRDDAGRAVASGIYFLRLASPEARETRKVVLAR